MKKLAFAAVAAAMLAFGPTANATTTIDFSEYSSNSYYPELITKEGFWFTNFSGFRTPVNLFDADPINTAIATALPGGNYTIVSPFAGGTFDLISIDLADRLNLGTSGSVDFLFSNGNTLTSILDFSQGLQTVALNQNGIEWFAFVAATGRPTFGVVQFDNVVVDNISSAVPEPATWAMMIVGFFGLGAMMRRRRSFAAAAA